MKLLALLLVNFSFALNAHALVIEREALVPPGDILKWNAEFNQRAKASAQSFYAECREVSSLKGAQVCLFNGRGPMNDALLRASVSVEGLGKYNKGDIPKHDDSALIRIAPMAGGHDLPGEELAAFYERTALACETAKQAANVCFSAEEKEFYEKIVLPRTERREPLVVIGFEMKAGISHQSSVGHELLHAQYFLSQDFREVVDQFWIAELTDEDRARVRQRLSGLYDVKIELLMRNEFQAYVLMPDAGMYQLGNEVPRFAVKLKKALADRGLAPIEIL
ncbi:MAG: hypothetical protein EOP11_11485 [Proteobacteria bacterium]|nr:MAG: hypothetical protein EOP11_11485 [Pseudomonadota bacterium]